MANDHDDDGGFPGWRQGTRLLAPTRCSLLVARRVVRVDGIEHGVVSIANDGPGLLASLGDQARG